jgi:RND family efflux transporter MFP subunit
MTTIKNFVFFFAGLLLACVTVTPSHARSEPSPETIQVRPAVRTVSLSGYTRAKRVMTVTSEVDARCIEVRVDVGDTIPASAVLARLDTTFMDLDLRQTTVRIDQAGSRIAYLLTETNRSRELVKRETQARTHLDRLEQDLDQAGLLLEELRAEKSRLEERKARHILSGPSGWTVITRDMEPGEWIAAGTPVATLGDFRTLRIPLALAPEEFDALQRAGSLAIRLADQKTPCTASVFRIAPDFDPATRKTNVELLITPPEGQHRGGLRCELDLEIPEPPGTFEVPARAVFERYETHWVTRENGTEVKVVLLGAGKTGFVKIVSKDLSAGAAIRVRP